MYINALNSIFVVICVVQLCDCFVIDVVPHVTTSLSVSPWTPLWMILGAAALFDSRLQHAQRSRIHQRNPVRALLVGIRDGYFLVCGNLKK